MWIPFRCGECYLLAAAFAAVSDVASETEVLAADVFDEDVDDEDGAGVGTSTSVPFLTSVVRLPFGSCLASPTMA